MGRKPGKDGLKRVTFDTLEIVKLFKDEPGAEFVQTILDWIEYGALKGNISSVTVAELFYILARHKNVEFARNVLRKIKISRLKIIDLDDTIAEIGGGYKFIYASKNKKGMPIADALVAATSKVKDSILLCEGEHFWKIKEISISTPKDFVSTFLNQKRTKKHHRSRI